MTVRVEGDIVTIVDDGHGLPNPNYLISLNAITGARIRTTHAEAVSACPSHGTSSKPTAGWSRSTVYRDTAL
nr:hypothetical protein [Exiguobacterium sp. s22]